MSPWDLVWLGWMLLFVALELPAIANKTPWVTLSQVAWWTENRAWPMRLVFLFGLALLISHIVAGRPGRHGGQE
jgi:hypothetical protein